MMAPEIRNIMFQTFPVAKIVKSPMLTDIPAKKQKLGSDSNVAVQHA